jgi:hypothetical protein
MTVIFRSMSGCGNRDIEKAATRSRFFGYPVTECACIHGVEMGPPDPSRGLFVGL